jgi:hypothetical protein
VIAVATPVLWVVAVLIFVVIAGFGLMFVRSLASMRPKERIEPEDVEGLDVFLVCGECGTEFQVTRIGEMQIPRHCGEPMQVIRRPREPPLGS